MASTIRVMSKPLPPSRTAPQFVVRFPDEEMRDRIKRAAEANNRSMNAEIIARLQDSFVAESEFHVGPGLFGSAAAPGATSYQQALADALRNDIKETAHSAITKALADADINAKLAEALKQLSLADSLKEAAQKALDDTSIAKAIPPKK